MSAIQPSLWDGTEPAKSPLKTSTEVALRLLKQRRHEGLTQTEFRELAGYERLARCVGEIRIEHGHDSVETIYEPNGNGGHHGRYFWRAA